MVTPDGADTAPIMDVRELERLGSTGEDGSTPVSRGPKPAPRSEDDALARLLPLSTRIRADPFANTNDERKEMLWTLRNSVFKPRTKYTDSRGTVVPTRRTCMVA